jgi:hypothetical protein
VVLEEDAVIERDGDGRFKSGGGEVRTEEVRRGQRR